MPKDSGLVREPFILDTRLSVRNELILAGLLLLLAAILRMGWPGLTEFKSDEARLTLLAMEMVEGKHFPIRGISSSVGLANFPMSVWLYAIPLLIWNHVYAATLFTGLLNVLAVLGCYWFVRRYWGVEAALAATLMFAVSPWAIHHSRKIWAQNLLPFFVMGWGITGALAFIEKRPKIIIFHIMSMAIAIQVHLAGAALFPATLLMFLIFRHRIKFHMVLIGGVIAGLTLLPFIYYIINIESHIFSNLSDTMSPQRSLDGQVLSYAWLLTTGADIHSLTGAEAYPDYQAQVPDISPVHMLWGVLVLGGFGWLVWLTYRKWSNRKQTTEVGFLVIIWVLSPLLFFSWPRLPIALHYLLPIYPAQYIMAGILFSCLVKEGGYRRIIGWSILPISIIAQLWIWGKLLLFISSQNTPGGFGTPLAMQLEASTKAVEMLSNEGAAEILIVGKGENPEVEEFPAIYASLLHSVPHRFIDSTKSAVFPATKTIVLSISSFEPVASLFQEAAISQEQINLRNGEGVLQILVLPKNSAPIPEFTFSSPHIMTNWVAFWGYDTPILQKDGSALWQIYWYVGVPNQVDYHIFNHLLDNMGKRISQKDAAAFSASQWREKDLVISNFTMPWPETFSDPLIMRIGMYTYPELETVLFFDEAGNPTKDALEITLP